MVYDYEYDRMANDSDELYDMYAEHIDDDDEYSDDYDSYEKEYKDYYFNIAKEIAEDE